MNGLDSNKKNIQTILSKKSSFIRSCRKQNISMSEILSKINALEKTDIRPEEFNTFVIERLYYVLTTKERFEIFSFGFVGLFLAFAGIVLYRSDAFVLAWSSLFLTFLCFVFLVKSSFKTKKSLLISM